MILHNEQGLAIGGVVWMHLTDIPGDIHPCGEAAFPLDGDPYALIDEIHANGTQALPSRDPEPERTFLTITPDEPSLPTLAVSATGVAALLPRLLGLRRSVVALGGGAVESPPSVDLLAAHPRVLGLRVDASVRVARQQAAPRPALVAGGLEAETARLDARRRDAYARSASAWVDSDCPLQQTVDCALDALALRGFGPS